MSETEKLPPFPVDDATLAAVEHSLDACLTFDRPADAAEDDPGPWVIGADFPLPRLLDFLAGAMGDDPNAEVIDPGEYVSPDAPMADQIAGARIVYDSRPHYSEHDVIRALLAEVRRLRSEGSA